MKSMAIGQVVLEFAVFFGFACIVTFVCVGPIAWAVGDAQQRGRSSYPIAMLVALLGPFATLVWLVGRPSRKLIDRSPDLYQDPGDALEAAARLDQLGEWYAAMALYKNVAPRWPDNSDYIGACLKEIKWKQAISEKRIK